MRDTIADSQTPDGESNSSVQLRLTIMTWIAAGLLAAALILSPMPSMARAAGAPGKRNTISVAPTTGTFTWSGLTRGQMSGPYFNCVYTTGELASGHVEFSVRNTADLPIPAYVPRGTYYVEGLYGIQIDVPAATHPGDYPFGKNYSGGRGLAEVSLEDDHGTGEQYGTFTIGRPRSHGTVTIAADGSGSINGTLRDNIVADFGSVRIRGSWGPCRRKARSSSRPTGPSTTPTSPSTSPGGTSGGPAPGGAVSCPDVAVYGVRGSAQDLKGEEDDMGPEIHAFTSELERRLPKGTRVLKRGVPYPAAAPKFAAFNAIPKLQGLPPFNLSPALGSELQVAKKLSPYNRSVALGARLLLAGVPQFEGIEGLVRRCPGVKVIVAGVSQGAQVISTAFSQVSNDDAMAAVRGVFLFADAARHHGEPYNVGVDERDGILADPELQPGDVAAHVAKFLEDRTRSYCLVDDPICSSNVGDLVKHQDIHLSYAESLFLLQAADLAARTVYPGGTDLTFQVAPSHYVALGDSYASGEGTADYLPGTATDPDSCHRSPESYASLLGAVGSSFRACSGATSSDLFKLFKGEPAQLRDVVLGNFLRSRLHPNEPVPPAPISAVENSVDLVTLNIGGDDLGFSHVLSDCLDLPVGKRANDITCLGAIHEAVDKLYGRVAGHPSLADALTHVLINIHLQFPHARIIVVGYPRLFPAKPTFPQPGCGGIYPNWQAALNRAADSLNQVMGDAVAHSGLAEYIDTTATFQGHDACGHPSTVYLNDLAAHCPLFNGATLYFCSESFHPTVSGYRAERSLIFQRLHQDLLVPPVLVKNGERVGLQSSRVSGLNVPPGSRSLDLQVTWPGSTVRVELRDPSGHLVGPGAAGVVHTTAATSDDWSVANPKPGRWRLDLFGAHVAPAGEPVAVAVQAFPGGRSGQQTATANHIPRLLLLAILPLVALAALIGFLRSRRSRRATAS